MKTKLLLPLVGLFAIAGKTTAQVDAGATMQTKNLYYNLKEVAWDTRGVLFGQQFYNSFSMVGGNHENESVSDFKDVTGDHPAVLGQDFQFYISKTATARRRHKEAALYTYNNGGVVTFDFHMFSKYHTSTSFVTGTGDQFLMYNIGQNIDTYGEVTWFKGQLDQAISVMNELKIPVVFRLLHEMNGAWFWWGNQAAGGSSSYKKMYQLAVNYIKARTNYAIFAWSPNYPFNSGTYPGTSYYPGNQYVDVVGLDMYDINTNNGQPFSTMVNELTALSDFAWSNNKVPVFAEVGNRVNSPDDYAYWWYNLEDYMQGGARSYKVAWMLTWVNQGWDGPAYAPYVAYSGSSAGAKQALIAFKNKSTVLTLSDASSRNMYNSSYKSSMGAINDNSIVVNIKDETGISIYPNPVVNEYFNINLGKFSGSAVDITVTNTEDQQIISKQKVSGTPTIKVSVAGLSRGVYIVSIKGDNINETQKLLVE